MATIYRHRYANGSRKQAMMVARLQDMKVGDRAPTMPTIEHDYDGAPDKLGPSLDKRFERAPKAAVLSCGNCGNSCRIRLVDGDTEKALPSLKAALAAWKFCPRQPPEIAAKIKGWCRAQEAPKPARKPKEPRNALGGLAYK